MVGFETMNDRARTPNRDPLRLVFQLVVAAFAIFCLTVILRFFWDDRALVGSGGAVESSGLLEYERNTVQVFRRASAAVVFVHNLQYQRNFWTFDVTEVQQGTGSGFLWDRAGHIVTNFHVVQGASRVAVTLIDGKTYEARIVGVEPRKDLAVLKIDLVETNVKPLGDAVADTAGIVVGQKAIAIGNPFGLDHTLTVGTISAVGRSMNSIVQGVTIRDMIQTDAAINPGNSGGPLLDSQGRLVGMNTLILKNSTGIGFAVPSSTISRIVRQIVEHGRPTQAGIGVTIYEDRVSRGIAMQLGVKGMLLKEVVAGSPAERAGLRGTSQDRNGLLLLGDIVQSIDGSPIASYDDMYNAFDLRQPGEVIDVGYFRDGESRVVKVEVVDRTD